VRLEMSWIRLAICVPSLSDNTSGRAGERFGAPSAGDKGVTARVRAVIHEPIEARADSGFDVWWAPHPLRFRVARPLVSGWVAGTKHFDKDCLSRWEAGAGEGDRFSRNIEPVLGLRPA